MPDMNITMYAPGTIIDSNHKYLYSFGSSMGDPQVERIELKTEVSWEIIKIKNTSVLDKLYAMRPFRFD